ncbi:MAG: class I SAM-dependent methyltransferase [Chitinophagaceae bacterium]|nr:class I SAM-dependent methyltransferase [Chitinophagaceae bacterium]
MAKEWTGERLETNIWGETTAEHLHRYAMALELAKNKTILDLACGEGYGAHLLSKTAASVTGIDIDINTIDRAAKKYTASNLKFLTAPATAIPLQENSIDVVISFETIEHLSDHDAMIKECKRVLKPGGLLIISTPNKDKYSGKPGQQNPFHLKELSGDEFRTLLRKYFTQVQLLNQYALYSSLITDENLIEHSGDFNELNTDTNSPPLYFIALASDEKLPDVKQSIFNAASIANKALEEKEKAIKSSAGYKTGHFILSPFKFIKNLFAGKKKKA